MYTLDPDRDNELAEFIDARKREGDTLGGIVEIRVEGVPYGLGTHTQWDKKLDGRLAQAVMAVQAMKGVEIGMGFEAARRPGSQVHDPIQFDATQVNTRSLGFTRTHNNAGGLEAGMTNSQPLVLRVAMKPISTLAKPLESVNLQTKQSEIAAYERSDVSRSPPRAASWRTSSPSRSPARSSTSSAATIWRKSSSGWICSTRWQGRSSTSRSVLPGGTDSARTRGKGRVF